MMMARRRILLRNRTRIAMCVTVCAGLFGVAGPAQSAALGGDAINALIIDALAAQNLTGNPAIPAERTFRDCAEKLTIEPMFGSWSTVAVKCHVGVGWKIAIRTHLTTRPNPVAVKEFASNPDILKTIDGVVLDSRPAATLSPSPQDVVDVVVLTRSLVRGEVILAEDLALVPLPQNSLIGVFHNPADLVGRRVKSAVTASRPVKSHQLEMDFMVDTDSEVLIVSMGGGISVDMLGFALEKGQFGDWIDVENASSGKTIRAKVIGEKKVAVIAKKS